MQPTLLSSVAEPLWESPFRDTKEGTAGCIEGDSEGPAPERVPVNKWKLALPLALVTLCTVLAIGNFYQVSYAA